MTSDAKQDILRQEIEKLRRDLKQKLADHDVKNKGLIEESTESTTLKRPQSPKLSLATTPLDCKVTQETPRNHESSTSYHTDHQVDNEASNQEENEARNRLQIINLEANEDSAISRFWSIEPGSRQGIRIKLFRNGDRFFPGMEYVICHTKCRTLAYLFEQLNTSTVRDLISMPYGVRALFNLQGQKVKDILELKDGGIYVVSSVNNFKKIDYLALQGMQEWRGGLGRKKGLQASISENNRLEVKKLNAIKMITSEDRLACVEKKGVVGDTRKNVLIYVVRNDVLRPRKVIKWLLGPKTGGTFERVMIALSEKLAFGFLRKLHSSDGTEVMCLDDLYLKANQVFFGFGQEQVKRSDFILEKDEIALITELTRKAGSQQNDKVLIIPFVHNDPDKPVLLEHHKLNDEVLCNNENRVCLRMCKDVKTNNNYILKIFDMRTLTKPQQLKVRREMKIMRMIKHTNLVYADIITFDDNFSCLYIKKFPKCSLAEILLNDNHYHCERFISDVVMQISRGLEHLASYQIANRNVTLESVVTDITFSGLVQFKLCDFGLARKIKSLDKKLYLICGNPFYIAPEMLLEEGYDTRVDVWSLGVLMYVLLTGEFPFRGRDLNDCNGIFCKISEAHLDMKSHSVWDLVSAEAKELLNSLLTSDPNLRISPQKIQTHAWTSQASVFAPEKDLRPVVKGKMYRHIVEQEMMSLDCLEVLCLSSIDKDPYYFINTMDCAGTSEGEKNEEIVSDDVTLEERS